MARLQLTPKLRARAAIGAAVLVVLLVAAHLVLNSAGIAQTIRETALEKLQARLGPVALGDRAEISWTGEARLGPLAIPAGPGEPPLVHVDEIRVRPSLWSLVKLHPELARVTLVGPTIEVDERGERVKRFRERLPQKKSGAGGGDARERALPLLVLQDARVIIDRKERTPLQVGPIDARASLHTDATTRAVDLKLSAGHGSARLTGSLKDGEGHLLFTADGLPLAAIAPSGADAPISLQKGALDGSAEIDVDADHNAKAKVDLGVRELVASGPRLASEPVGPLEGRYKGTVRFDRGEETLQTDDSRVLLGPKAVEIPFEGNLDLHAELHFEVDARVGPVALQQLVAALPPQLRPPETAPKVDGSLRAEIRASGPLRRIDEWTVGVRLDTKDLKAKARAAPFALREPFVYHPDDPSGVARTIQVGDKNPNFVPYDALPAIVPEAVITSEDGNFFKHEGFDFDEIRDSIATAAEGERLRGGSTLSQQLVKNLYLSRERTLARKLKEAIVTLEVEAGCTKQRLLEIYLNIIEWGPGVYGIGEAAHYYFGVDAAHLTPKQAVFLATIIPNPVKYSVYFRKGATSKNWDDHMAHLIDKLHERGALNDEQYQRALADPVVFRKPPG